MLFSSLEFIFVFLPIILIFYYTIPRKGKNYILLIFSLLFYAWGGVSYTLILIFSIIFNYIFVKQIWKNTTSRKKWLVTGLIFNISLIIVFKYSSFSSSNPFLFLFFMNFFDLSVFLKYLGFIFISFLIPFLLWHFDFWKAGDAKFYFVLSTMVHPTSSLTLQPLIIFLILSVMVSLVESILNRTFEFKPSFNVGFLLPLVFVPFLSFSGYIFPFSILLMLIGNKLRKFEVPIIIVSLVIFFMMPGQSLKMLVYPFLLFIFSSIKFKGHFPSAPFISVSFIYFLIFGRL